MLKHSFNYQGVKFSIDMPERIMYISDNSATGKGLFSFAQQYDDYCREHIVAVNFRNYKHIISNIRSIQDDAQLTYILDNYELYANDFYETLKDFSQANFLIITKDYSLIKDICRVNSFLKVYRTANELSICRRK